LDGGEPLRKLSVSVLAWLRLARIFQKVNRTAATYLRSCGLSVAQFDVLAQVGVANGITQQELADALLVSKGNVCQLLDRMEQGGLIERRQEGRINHLFLTPRGRRPAAEVVPAREALIAQQFAALPLAEQTRLLALLRQLDHALN
jgi:DNA-binding MarR family transcriptional regulator